MTTISRETTETEVERSHRLRWGTFATPLLIAVVLGALWFWLSRQRLDSIEKQSLNFPYIFAKLGEHVELTAYSTLIVVAVAIPCGILLSRPRMKRLAVIALGVANVGQAAPSIAVIIIAAMLFGVGVKVAVFALAIYAILPVLRNTIVGLQQVDPAIIDAGRGMGFSKLQVLTRVELPLAVPIILTGLRTALVLNVGTATMAAFVNAGGLGEIVTSGMALQRTTVLLTGSVLVALLAVLIDWSVGLVQAALTKNSS
ncbi:MAG: ABC transporter permease [Candidatus Saccharibacteria bacterium]|nr:ABC transporter permease [Microbacteriaceae bacterium]